VRLHVGAEDKDLRKTHTRPSPIDSFIKIYVDALREQSAAIFAGAGLSIPAGLVNWKDLLRDVVHDVGLNVDKETDLISAAQYHVNERRGRHKINQALIDEFAGRAKSTENHTLLASLPIKTYWTTNYDTLIEDALRANAKLPDVKITVQNLATTLARRDAVVYKMHGDVSQPDKAVVTKDDYESYDAHRHLFSTALQGDLVSKTFLFIGFSFNDPNLSYILSRIRMLLGENRREHFCLMRRVQRKDFDRSAAYHYAKARQELQVRDLTRYGIIGLLVDSYDEYTDILRSIYQRYSLGRVFISGSAEDYGAWTKQQAREFLEGLSSALVREGFGVVTGFGLGVGPYVLNGVLRELEATGTRSLDDRLTLRPFPIDIVDPSERKRRWTAYRQEIIRQSGVALFVFGNKNDASGKTVLADGMEEEFELAVSAGRFVIPVGCTGSMAEELHEKVVKKFDKYNPPQYRAPVQALAKMRTPKEVVARVVKLLKRLRDSA
jgi:hypothetical protein